MTKVTPLASGDGVAVFATRRTELAAEQRDSAEWRRPGAGVGRQHVLHQERRRLTHEET